MNDVRGRNPGGDDGDDGDDGREGLAPRFAALAEEFQRLQKRHARKAKANGPLPELDPWPEPPPVEDKAVTAARDELRSTLRGPSDWTEPARKRLWLVSELYPWGLLGMISGDGGTGKTQLMQQLLTCVAMGRPWLGFATIGCRALGIFCEDSNEDVQRRQEDINRHYDLKLGDLDGMLQFSCRASMDNVLMEFDQRTNVPTRRPFFWALRELIMEWGPGLVVIDTVAEVYGGNENVRTQVSQFLNAIKALGQEADCTIILTAHPSLTGMGNKSGLSGSTHWNNGVRARLYLKRPEDDEGEVDLKSPRRFLHSVKANFGATGDIVPLLWTQGVFMHANQDPLLANAGMREVENYFMETLDKLAAQGRFVSASPTGNYAPKLFVKEPDNPGFSAANLYLAMNNLFHANQIKVMEMPDARHRMKPRIVRVAEPSAGPN